MRMLSCVILILILSPVLVPAQVLGHKYDSTSADERSAVLESVDQLLNVLRTRDTAAIRQFFLPDAQLISVHESENPISFRRWTIDTWLVALAGRRDPLIERVWDPEVRIEGTLATVWGPYDVHYGSRFSHCGMDSFQLVRLDGSWRMAAITWTNRKTGCKPPAE